MAITLIERRPAHRAYRAIGSLLAVAVLLYLPWFAHKPARIDQFSEVAAFAVAILGLNLVLGFSGQIALGHSAFVGLGAYTTVILVADHHWSYFATIPLAFVLSFVVGLLVGVPALRIRGLYLAVVTLAVATVFPTLVLKFDGLTGGPNGKQARTKLVPPSWTPFKARTRFGPAAYRYFVILLIATVMFALVVNLMHSRAGRALIALRDNQTSAVVSGVSPPIYKTLIFGLSAGIASVGGSLLMIQQPQATDGKFGVDLAIFLVVALVIGGVGTIAGAVPGALAFVFIPYYSSQWSPKVSFLKGRPGAGSVAGVIYGLLLVIFVFVLPGGMIDGIRRLRSRILTIVPNPPWLSSFRPDGPDIAAATALGDEAISEPVLQQYASTTTRGNET
jgi:branched-chain amino acid transport system permease protein